MFTKRNMLHVPVEDATSLRDVRAATTLYQNKYNSTPTPLELFSIFALIPPPPHTSATTELGVVAAPVHYFIVPRFVDPRPWLKRPHEYPSTVRNLDNIGDAWTSPVPASGNAFESALREDSGQPDAVMATLRHLGFPEQDNTRPKHHTCALLCLPCGFGKTVVAIAIACLLRRRTFVIVPNYIILNQWIQRFKEHAPSVTISAYTPQPKNRRGCDSFNNAGDERKPDATAECAPKTRWEGIRQMSAKVVISKRRYNKSGGWNGRGMLPYHLSAIINKERSEAADIQYTDKGGNTHSTCEPENTGDNTNLWKNRNRYLTTDVTVAVMSSLNNLRHTDHFDGVGFLVVDEAHHAACITIREALVLFNPKCVLALTATPDRKDGLGGFLNMAFGKPVDLKASAPCLTASSAEVKLTMTAINVPYATSQWWPLRRITRPNARNTRWNMAQVLSNIALSKPRMQLVARTVANLPRDRIVLVVADRRELVVDLAALLTKILSVEGLHTVGVLLGGGASTDKSRKRKRDSERAIIDNARIIVTTPSYAGEGFDVPRLNTLVVALPMNDMTQMVGRVTRRHPGKHTAHVIDFADLQPPPQAPTCTVAVGLYYSRRKQLVAMGAIETGLPPTQTYESM